MLKKSHNPTDIGKAIHTVVDLLSRRDHCRQELLLKLQQRGYATNTAEQAVLHCHEQGWFSETNYARIYVRQRAHKGYGIKRIDQELTQRQLSGSDIELAFEALEQEEQFDWFESALKQKRKKFGCEVAADLKLKQKQQAYLYRRGFTSEQIDYAVNQREL